MRPRGGEVTPVVSSDPVATSTHHIRNVPGDLWRLVCIAAAALGITRSAFVIGAIKQRLDREQAPEPKK